MTVLVIGPDLNAKGGIASVLKMYQQAGLFKQNQFLASTTDGSIIWRVLWFFVFYLRYWWMLLTTPSIHIVHIHLAIRGSLLRKFLVLQTARVLGKKTIVHFHGAQFVVFYQRCSGWMRRLLHRMFFNADEVLCLNQACQKHIQEITGIQAHVLYNPTVLQKPAIQKTSSIHLLFMGRLCQRKGVYDLIEAARLLPPRQSMIHLYGDGELEQVQQAIQQAGVSDRIIAHGWVSGAEKDTIFQASQVLLLPSYNEGLPISVLEALAHGLPVISTPVGGIPDAVEDGINGFLVQPGDINTLAARIQTLSLSEPLRVQMGQTAYQRAQSHFELSKIMAELHLLYHNVNLTMHRPIRVGV